MTPEQKAEMEIYMKAGAPGAPHKSMAESVGSFKVVVKTGPEPGGPPTEESGSATRAMILDGRILVETFNCSMMGQPFSGQGMHGFDNVTGKHWSTWVDSMSTGMMVSEGTCDAANECRFTGTYNDPVKQAPVTARMISRRTSPTTELFEMWGPGKDGKELKMMEIIYTKQ